MRAHHVWPPARVALFTIFCAARLTAQGSAPDAPSKYEQALRAAEVEAANYSRDASDTTVRRCVRVNGQVMQSGNFESRGWADYAALWQRGYGKVTWWPAFPQRADSLTVRMVSALGDKDTSTFTYRGPPVINRGTGRYMYPSGVRLPRRGAWLFLATAGPNWGCFLYVF